LGTISVAKSAAVRQRSSTLPVFEPSPIRKPGESGHGFIVVAVTRSALVPHAVIVNQGFPLPAPQRHDHQVPLEPKVAWAYGERFAGARRQVGRIEEVEQEALRRLDSSGPDERGWRHLRLLSSAGNTYNRDYFGEDEDGRQRDAQGISPRG